MALARRDALPQDARKDAAEAVAASALPFPLQPGAVVAGYHPFRSELDPLPLLNRCAGAGMRLALPRVAERGQPLIFAEWHPGEALVRGAYGLSEPPAHAPPLDPQVVLVPLVAFDRQGHRLGYGAGYYDRTLKLLRARRPVLTVGIGFAIQEVDAIPAAAHDERMDFVLTELGVMDLRRP
jgi:5-formyltetrahydrofolate cyclo-ligase